MCYALIAVAFQCQVQQSFDKLFDGAYLRGYFRHSIAHLNHEIDRVKTQLELLLVAHNSNDGLCKQQRKISGTLDEPGFDELKTLHTLLRYS